MSYKNIFICFSVVLFTIIFGLKLYDEKYSLKSKYIVYEKYEPHRLESINMHSDDSFSISYRTKYGLKDIEVTKEVVDSICDGQIVFIKYKVKDKSFITLFSAPTIAKTHYQQNNTKYYTNIFGA